MDKREEKCERCNLLSTITLQIDFAVPIEFVATIEYLAESNGEGLLNVIECTVSSTFSGMSVMGLSFLNQATSAGGLPLTCVLSTTVSPSHTITSCNGSKICGFSGFDVITCNQIPSYEILPPLERKNKYDLVFFFYLQRDVHFGLSFAILCQYRINAFGVLFNIFKCQFTNVGMHIRLKGNFDILVFFDWLVVETPHYIGLWYSEQMTL